MKLQNKKTGEIGYTAVLRSKAIVVMDENAIQLGSYTSLAELNAEWEDYDPKIKKYWWVSPLDCGVVEDDLKWNGTEYDDEIDKFNVEIGNYFSSREEAEKAVEKLKAWKRLKDKGFRFDEYHIPAGEIHFNMTIQREDMDEFIKDMDICFGGEE